ncbi:MAG TPA: 23S rRNA (uracil(1939)-C(5))-methyltransferase RlmD [Candidatus Binatia bacterium]|nr:23S rRNA (uracil(1939)-C(5))-methyltransferase RlmD [Candidatus Binatia bacterium]
MRRAHSGDYRPPCIHYPHCVGCPFIDMPYAPQLARKRAIVVEALAAYPSLSGIDIPPVVPSSHRLGYRSRVKLVVRKNRSDIAIGLYVPQSHRVIDISSCPVHPRPVNQVLHYLKRKILELGIAPYDERDDSGELRYVDLRYSFTRRELSVTLVSRHASLPHGEKLARALQRKFSSITGVMQNVNESRGNVIWGDVYRTLSGRDSLLEQVGGLKLVYPVGVFSQANPYSAQRLYEKVVELAGLSGVETVLDLYCGVGPIAFYLARSARQVWGVDDSESAIDAAKQNARRNGVSNCRFRSGDAAQLIRELRQANSRVDVIVLNPPRKGVQPAALEAILEVGAPKLVYVSCEPKSLARDLDRLSKSNYRVGQIQPFDMFPQTGEVENVVLLIRN